MVSLPNTLYDISATLSLISRSKADATLGSILPSPTVSHKTAFDDLVTSKSTITLRWRYEHGTQAFQELFHIIEDESLNGYDAVLRGTIAVNPPSLDEPSLPSAHPIYLGQPGRGGKAEREKREQDLKHREKAYKEEVAKQREQLRKQLDGGKGAGGAGGRR